MKSEKIPLLGYALLGLLHQVPLSGYGVRKMFSSSPMGSYSDSPGAIYPALQRLEKAGLIRGRVEDSSGLRRAKIYRPTDAGVVALKQWLKSPVTREEVVRGLSEIALRLSFMDPVIGEAGTLQFLRALQDELQAYIPTLWEYFHANRKKIPQSGILAFESGIRGYETFLDLCKHGIVTYESKAKGGSS